MKVREHVAYEAAGQRLNLPFVQETRINNGQILKVWHVKIY